MKNSCGAIFYTYDPNGTIGIILGLEGVHWFPFKGCAEPGESLEQTAIREIKEETCGLVNLDKIHLEHYFTSKRKHYYIGLCLVDYNIIDMFSNARIDENRKEYREKKRLKFFTLQEAIMDSSVHSITKASIKYFWNKLMYLNNLDTFDKIRKQSVTVEFAKNVYQCLYNNPELERCGSNNSSESSNSNEFISSYWSSKLDEQTNSSDSSGSLSDSITSDSSTDSNEVTIMEYNAEFPDYFNNPKTNRRSNYKKKSFKKLQKRDLNKSWRRVE